MSRIQLRTGGHVLTSWNLHCGGDPQVPQAVAARATSSSQNPQSVWGCVSHSPGSLHNSNMVPKPSHAPLGSQMPWPWCQALKLSSTFAVGWDVSWDFHAIAVSSPQKLCPAPKWAVCEILSVIVCLQEETNSPLFIPSSWPPHWFFTHTLGSRKSLNKV